MDFECLKRTNIKKSKTMSAPKRMKTEPSVPPTCDSKISTLFDIVESQPMPCVVLTNVRADSPSESTTSLWILPAQAPQEVPDHFKTHVAQLYGNHKDKGEQITWRLSFCDNFVQDKIEMWQGCETLALKKSLPLRGSAGMQSPDLTPDYVDALLCHVCGGKRLNSPPTTAYVRIVPIINLVQ